MSIRLIAGLGNPGRKHERDRHNVGFWFVSRLAALQKVEMRSQPKFHGVVGRARLAPSDVWFVMPQTYMNASGMAVGALARFYKIGPEECLIVHDELDFAPGVTKLKRGGGVAGHNGLRDVADQLGTLIGERGARLQGHDGGRVAQPCTELLGDAIGDLRVARDPQQALAGGTSESRGKECLRAVGHRGVRDMTQRAANCAWG